VIVIFLGFGYFISLVNKNLLNSKENIKRIFTITGIISIIVGINFLTA